MYSLILSGARSVLGYVFCQHCNQLPVVFFLLFHLVKFYLTLKEQLYFFFAFAI